MDTIQCSELTVLVLTAMSEEGYTESTVQRKHRHIFNNLVRYCIEYHQGMYTPLIGEKFLSTIANKDPPYSNQWSHLYSFAVQRLNHAIGGNFHWVYTPAKEYAHSRFDSIVKKYDEYLASNKRKTIKNRRTQVHVILRFLQYIDDAGLTNLQDISIPILYKSFLDVKTSKNNYASFLKPFLQYLHKYEFINADLRTCIHKRMKQW